MNDRSLTRRELLATSAAGTVALALGLPRVCGALDDPTGKPNPGKIGDFKISLAEWSLNRRLFGADRDPAAVATRNLEFPRTAREEFGIDAVEYVNQFFKDKVNDSAYLSELKKRASDQGVTNVLIMIDGEGDVSSPEKAQRIQAVENHKRWVDAARALGCHAIRINTGDHYSPVDVANAAEACALLAEYGKANKIHVICENHGGPSSNPDALIALIKAVGSDYFGTLPDFGNFPKDPKGAYTIDVYEAIARMMPFAKGVSAKSYAFDDKGRETSLDFARILKIVTDSGYKGHVGIEFEGHSPEPEGILATKKLLETLRGSDYQG